VLILLLVVELFLAGRRLAYDEPTAPPAWQSMRTATAQLLADDAGQPFRFLSMSDMGYDPGDLADLEALYGQCLSPEAVYNLIVVTKMKEVLAFNLPLRYRIASVDGYDGGLLPVARYVTLEKLFLAEDEIWPDGRLRQQLRRVPEARLLSLLNVKYVITDKTQDVWIDGVYYDLEHTVPLGRLALNELPAFKADRLGVVSYLTGTAELTDGTPVARAVITGTEGTVVSHTLRAGEHTAEGRYDDGPVAHGPARVGHRWRDEAGGNDYVALLDLGGPFQPQTIAIESLLPGRAFHLRGLTLVDAGSGTNRYLSIDPDYKLVHSGDVKVYENEAVLPRAFAVQSARVAAGDEAALEMLRDPAFDPAREVVLADGRPLAPGGQVAQAEIVAYNAEEVRLEVALDAPGYVVLTDAYYPGWVAEIDGRPAAIVRANIYFRAVAVGGGRHQVVFRYRPAGVRWGLAISLGALAVWLAGAAILALHGQGGQMEGSRIGRKRPSSV
jgi:hypothetical protein